jgi:hypothetical protein
VKRPLVIAFIALVLPIYGQEKAPKTKEQQSSTQSVENDQSTPAPQIVVVNQQIATKDQERSHNNSDSYLHHLLSPEVLTSIGLLIAATIGICVTVKTLKAIRRQALVMIQQARILEWQTKATEISAKAAGANARAAIKNIELFTSKERARLAIDCKPLKLDTKVVPDESARSVEFTVTIYGATAATILDSGVASGIFIKGQENDPDLASAVMFPMTGLPTLILPNMPSLELETFLFIEEKNETITLEAIQNENMVAAVRGFVRYRDIFDVIRTRRFRYYWGPSHRIPTLAGFWPDTSYGQWTKCGPPEDNQENPN